MYVSTQGLGKRHAHMHGLGAGLQAGSNIPLTPEQIATKGNLRICNNAAKSGAYMHNGKPAVIGTPEFNECLSIVTPMLAAGQDEGTAYKAALDHGTQQQVVQAAATGPNYLLWGAVGAGVLIIGAVLLTKK